MDIKIKVQRFDSKINREPYFQTYDIAAEPNERILDCLNRIRWAQDGSLAYRMSCGHGVCGSDAMRINGICSLACQKLVKDCKGPDIVVEPLPNFVVIKDLIVNMEPFFARVNQVRPYLIAAAEAASKEFKQLPEDRKKLDGVIRCILCACCTGACPNVTANAKFLGPAPLVQAFRCIFDSRDSQHLERLKQVDHSDGAWGCDNLFKCTQVCPKEILVTKSINLIKQEIEKSLR